MSHVSRMWESEGGREGGKEGKTFFSGPRVVTGSHEWSQVVCTPIILLQVPYGVFCYLAGRSSGFPSTEAHDCRHKAKKKCLRLAGAFARCLWHCVSH